MWNDLERGIIRSTTNVKADKRFIRPGLTKHIPVDSSGNVLSPLDSGYVNEFSFVSQKGKRFKFGVRKRCFLYKNLSQELIFFKTDWHMLSPVSDWSKIHPRYFTEECCLMDMPL